MTVSSSASNSTEDQKIRLCSPFFPFHYHLQERASKSHLHWNFLNDVSGKTAAHFSSNCSVTLTIVNLHLY